MKIIDKEDRTYQVAADKIVVVLGLLEVLKINDNILILDLTQKKCYYNNGL
jgi:hypothetical protein